MSDAHSIDQLLAVLLHSLETNARQQPEGIETLQLVWEKAVGPGMARHSRPMHAAGSTLVVGVDSDALGEELHKMAPELLRRLSQLTSRTFARVTWQRVLLRPPLRQRSDEAGGAVRPVSQPSALNRQEIPGSTSTAPSQGQSGRSNAPSEQTIPAAPTQIPEYVESIRDELKPQVLRLLALHEARKRRRGIS